MPPSPSPAHALPLIAGPALLLFVLPFAHVTALRSLGLAATLVVLVLLWRRGQLPRPPLLPWFGLWLLAALAALPGAIDAGESLMELRFDLGYGLLLLATFHALGQDARTFTRLSRVATASLGLLSALALVFFAMHGRWVISYQNALGEFATAVVTLLPVACLVALREPGGWRWLAWATVGLALAASVLNMSRALWGCLLLMALLVATLIGQRRHRLLLGLLASLGLAALTLVSLWRGVDFFDPVFRSDIWTHAMESIRQHPWFGSGYGRELNRQWYAILAASLPHPLHHPHNLWLAWTDQMGLPGLLAALLLPVALAHALWPGGHRPRPLALAGLAMALGVLAKSVTDMFFYGQNLLLFWALLGLLLGQMRATENHPPEESP